MISKSFAQKMCVTTSTTGTKEINCAAFYMAEALNAVLLKRGKRSIQSFFDEGFESVIVSKPDKLVVLSKNKDESMNEFFFHPGLSVMRIKRIINGDEDLMIKAMKLKSGDKLLDCTMGLGSDAIVSSWVVGEEGEVTALESNAVIFEIVKHGLTSYNGVSKSIKKAFERIRVNNYDYEEYLASCCKEVIHYDVVYFDPMFTSPNLNSEGINPLRTWANEKELGLAAFDNARLVARKSIVVKDDLGFYTLERLRILNSIGSRNGSFCYGYLYKSN